MNEPQRLKPCVLLPEEISGPDPLSLGSVTLWLPFDTPAAPRTRDELKRVLREESVNSVEDVCRAFDVRVRGTYKDADGQLHEVAIPVADEDTFSVDGLTRGDPRLQAMHIRARTYDECARYLAENDRDFLDEQEIAHLQATARAIEESLQETDHE